MPKPTKRLGQKLGQSPKGKTTKIRVFDAEQANIAAKNKILMDDLAAQKRKEVQSAKKGGR